MRAESESGFVYRVKTFLLQLCEENFLSSWSSFRSEGKTNVRKIDKVLKFYLLRQGYIYKIAIPIFFTCIEQINWLHDVTTN